ncbi:MAG: hypothetical protein HPY64_07580 [Anaerolineae bacterium]|nr:hypothetical protein [Anaerolineae bacterium]
MIRWRQVAVSIVLLALGLTLWSGPAVIRAQDDGLPAIRLMQTVFGTLDDETPELRWQFEARAGDRIAAVVQAMDGDLDAVLQVLDAGGRLLAEHDDIAFPDRLDAALEDVAIPGDGSYTLRVGRYRYAQGQTSGSFALTLLPAFADPLLWETFDGARQWPTSNPDLMEATQTDGRLSVIVRTANTLGWVAPQDGPIVPSRAYVQVEARVTNEPDYWEYGLIFRQSGPSSYYLFSVSSRGDWAFMARTGSSTWLRLRDWSEHPALADLSAGAELGVLMDGDAFTFYVNGQELDTVTADALSAPGSVALSVGTVDRQRVFPVVVFDNLLVTAPLPPAGADEEPVGATLEAWEAPDSASLVAELAALGLTPEGGRQVMLVPDSFTTVSRPGMQVLPLGQGRMQTDFVLGATVSMESEGADNACGLFFRRVDESRYSLAFVDGLGGVGLAEWQTDRFDPAFYRTDPGGFAGLTRARLLVVGVGDRVRVYLNGELAAERSNPPLQGGVGIAALSYDGRLVNCQFGNTWLWVWEE